MQVCVKLLGHIHAYEIIFFRAFVSWLFCLMVMVKTKVPFIGNRPPWMILRSVVGVSSMALFIITIQRMPLGASVSIKYLSPVFTGIFAALLLKEKVKPIQWLYFLMAFAGVLLMKGFDTRIDTISLWMGIVGALFGGMVYIIIRKIGQSEHPLTIVNYFLIFGSLLGAVLMVPVWQTPQGNDWLLILGMGLSGFLGQWFMTRAFQLEEASKIVPFKYLETIFALFMGWILFAEGYTSLAFLGIFMILMAMFLNVFARSRA